MKVAILGYTATSHGSFTSLKNFLPHLAQLDHSNQYEVFLPADCARELAVGQPNFRVHLGRVAPHSGALRVLWEQLILPWILWSNRVEVVYTTHNLAILLSPIPSITIVQNVEPFFAMRFPNAFWLRPRPWLLRFLTGLSLRRSRKIIAISEWEKDFLVERFHLPPGRIVVSYPGVPEGFHPPSQNSAAQLRERLGLEQPFILCATRLAGYGNLLNLAKAYASLVKQGKVAMPLVIPGGVWDSAYVGSVKKLLAREGCSERVRFLGYVPHQYMPLLFGHAECFVFPSLLEARGNVLIEALACGAPILCCRRRPMTDICRDAAVFFDGEDPAILPGSSSRCSRICPCGKCRHGVDRRAPPSFPGSAARQTAAVPAVPARVPRGRKSGALLGFPEIRWQDIETPELCDFHAD
jgi:glycosyltransferase involved in cell wall biosynthesis